MKRDYLNYATAVIIILSGVYFIWQMALWISKK